ncbi:23S rRNA (guanosine(2251)-2'-O)-methyltransferase RlmB [Mycoplasmopsis caviae]|uniref:23S rRNA (Guanosine(2251)-2'-O)-methyltransferase RlmB n=1 Tax=Mycoplasmopsis caviae TaxID=55603 RepID=A0A3P8MEJ6_9BACT|nr:23S rRNA (guanosine(2251)-2'-O)-methyltransferase RlmB [Mycoplasmopsis caviae]UUD35376.1 23S rRNA (guanosine(2251)-2'-O)-methyltransferase RlmB [Mycoplasmopsis caviae]VDR41846.1 rRNA methylase [Mycoplasmopsis caviae]
MEKLYLCGRNSVEDALRAKLPIETVFVNSIQLAQKFKQITKANVVIKDKNFFAQYHNYNHQGIVATLKDFPIYELESIKKDSAEVVLVLDHIQDPHNLGAIMRSANACGIKHLIISKERSANITSSVLKVSSGGFVNMKVIKVNSISASLTKLKKWGYWIYVSALDQNAQSVSKLSFNKPCVLVVGNEGDGVSKSTLGEADQVVYIPQKGSVQSLNVSVATGILLYEITKD